MNDVKWQLFDLPELKKKLRNTGVEYQDFLNVPSLSCGLYHLERGSKDMQTPHDEDEVYYVLDGRASLKIGDKEHSVSPGTLLYVRATEEHSFFEIEEDMILLVIFASSTKGSNVLDLD